jgi:hypothetical protein
MNFSHDKKETIRTIAAVLSDVCAIVSVILQAYGLHYIVTHPR